MKIKFIFLITIGLSVLACSRDETVSIDGGKNEELQEFIFQPYDSLTVDYLAGLFVMADKTNNGLFLGLDFMDKTVILFDSAGEIVNTFNRAGADPWSFGNYLYAIGFNNDSTINVLTEKGVYFYSLQGKLLKKLSYKGNFSGFQLNSQLQILPIELSDSTYLLTLTDFATDLRLSQPEFYQEARYFTLINTTNNKRQHFVSMEESTLYKQDKYYYPARVCPAFDVDRSKGELRVKYPLGNKMFTYSLLDNFKLIKITDVTPEHMDTPVGVPFDKPNSYTGFSTNGFYSHIFARGDTTFLFYTTEFDVNKFELTTQTKFFADPAGNYNQYRHLYTANYCQIFVGERKLCKDIKLPEDGAFVAWVDNLHSIIIGKETNTLDREEDSKKYYLYKLNPATEE